MRRILIYWSLMVLFCACADRKVERCADLYVYRQLVDPFNKVGFKNKKIILEGRSKSLLPSGMMKGSVSLFLEDEFMEVVFIKEIEPLNVYDTFTFGVEDITLIYHEYKEDDLSKKHVNLERGRDDAAIRKLYAENYNAIKRELNLRIDLFSEYYSYETLPEKGENNGIPICFSQMFKGDSTYVVLNNKYTKLTSFCYAGMRYQGLLSLGDTIIVGCGDEKSYHKEVLEDWESLDGYTGAVYEEKDVKAKMKDALKRLGL